MGGAKRVLQTGEKVHRTEDFPGATGTTSRPPEVFSPKADSSSR